MKRVRKRTVKDFASDMVAIGTSLCGDSLFYHEVVRKGKQVTEASRRRLELARKMAEIHARDPRLQAMLVAGSVARGAADDISDIDMSLYYSEMPTEAEIRAIREQ